MIGTTISHYKILEKLGEGGMGVVYKAEDTKLERTVALKFLTPQAIGSEEDKARFILEAKAAAKLDHPNICTVYEIDEADEGTFIAMAYVDGQSLEEKVESGVLEVHEALDIAMQVAEGLTEAHKKGIIHRDIKSANIMVTEDGQARIMDFGLAKLAGRTRLTKTSTIMGTVAYMSPEQASGETAIDHRTDIWSLGVVLYKMLTGYPPFDAPSDAALIHKIIYEELTPISKLRNDISSGLENIIRKMLQKNPRERHEDMRTLLFDLRTAKSRMVSMAGKSSPSIAVLPFVNMSADPEQEYFCDGLAEELINALTQLEDLHVIARTSAFSFKGKNVNVRDIGRELDVQNVLEGSVRKAGNRLRITAQLVETTRGRHLWSERYDREMDDIFAIQDGIASAIVDKLKPRLLGEEKAKLARRHTVGLEAYNLYLKGRWYMNRMTRSDLETAIGYFERATEEKPDYAAAFASLAISQGALSFFGFAPKEVFPKARKTALKALELDDTLGEAHESLGMIKQLYDWDWEGADKEFRQALDLNPGNALSHSDYAFNLMYTGRLEEAMAEMKWALQLDPLSPFVNRDAAILFWFAREPDMAIDVLTRTSELYPDYSITHFLLGIAYWIKSMYKEAMSEFQKEKESATGLDPLVETWVGLTWGMMGNREGLQQALEGLVEQSRRKYVPSFFLGFLSLFLGENDRGFEWLDKAYEERDVYLCYLKVHPFVDILDLRHDPRYIEILKKIGLDK